MEAESLADYYSSYYGIDKKSKGSGGIIITSIVLVILFAIVLAIVIISGRLLGQMNKSNCRNDEHISTARKLCTWIVAISSIAAGLLGLIMIIMVVYKFASKKKK